LTTRQKETTTMPVTPQELEDLLDTPLTELEDELEDEPAPRPARRPSGRKARRPAPPEEQRGYLWSLGLFSIFLGLALWIIGARYTLEGLVVGANMALGWASMPFTVPAPTGWWYLLALPVGAAYSACELRIPFSRPRSGAGLGPWLAATAGLVVLHGSDIVSTYLGYRAPTEQIWPLHAWAIAQLWPLVLWAIVLTYLPERQVVYGVQWIRESIAYLRARRRRR
jgi:hypothetical protein